MVPMGHSISCPGLSSSLSHPEALPPARLKGVEATYPQYLLQDLSRDNDRLCPYQLGQDLGLFSLSVPPFLPADITILTPEENALDFLYCFAIKIGTSVDSHCGFIPN